MRLRDLISTPRELPDLEVSRAFHYEETWNGDWRVAVETALEATHVPHVHPETLAKFGLAERACTMDEAGSMTTFDFPDEKRHHLQMLAAMFGQPPRLGDYVSIHAFPGTFITSTWGLTYSVQTFAPAPFGKLFFTTSDYTTPNVSTAYLKQHEAFSRRVHAEDRAACERVPAWLTSGALLPGEHRIARFREWLKRTGTQ